MLGNHFLNFINEHERWNEEKFISRIRGLYLDIIVCIIAALGCMMYELVGVTVLFLLKTYDYLNLHKNALNLI